MTYAGGKGQIFRQMLRQIPPHDVYISACLGHDAVLRAKRPARLSIGVERDLCVINSLWREHGIPGLQVVCADVLKFLPVYPWSGSEFVCIDPPYVQSACSEPRDYYRFNFTDKQHAELLTIANELTCMGVPVMVCGYWSELYGEALRGWRVVTVKAVKRSGRPALEYLWMNYPEPRELHDPRFAGANFRERERIKRKIARWRTKLQAMPSLERQAMKEALNQLEAASSGTALLQVNNGGQA